MGTEIGMTMDNWTSSNEGLFAGGFSAGMLADEMEALSDLMEESMELQGGMKNDRQTREEESAALGSQGRLGPGDIGPKVSKKPKEKEKEKALTNDIWETEEVPEEDLNWDDEGDSRPEPEYTVAYKQRVSSEDAYLGINGRDPGSHCCEDLVIKIKLEGVDAIDMISLDVTKNTLRVSTPTHRLAMYLPTEVKDKEGNAKWDSDTNELRLTLPIIHADAWNEVGGLD